MALPGTLYNFYWAPSAAPPPQAAFQFTGISPALISGGGHGGFQTITCLVLYWMGGS